MPAGALTLRSAMASTCREPQGRLPPWQGLPQDRLGKPAIFAALPLGT